MTIKGGRQSIETRMKISSSLKGKIVSQETRDKLSKANKGQVPWTKGRVVPKRVRDKISKANFGKKRTLEERKRMSEGAKGKSSGDKNHFWRGGITQKSSYYTRRRRVLRFNAIGSHNSGEWETLKAQYNWTCLCCKHKEPDIKLTEDHIVPLSKGGSDNIENIQPLCRSCNSKKSIKIIKYNLP